MIQNNLVGIPRLQYINNSPDYYNQHNNLAPYTDTYGGMLTSIAKYVGQYVISIQHTFILVFHQVTHCQPIKIIHLEAWVVINYIYQVIYYITLQFSVLMIYRQGLLWWIINKAPDNLEQFRAECTVGW